MSKRIGAEAKIIQLFTALPEDSKRIVMDVIKSQSPRKVKDPKSTAPAVTRRSSPKKEAAASTVNTEGDKESASLVSRCVVAHCGKPEGFPSHDSRTAEFDHIFHGEIKKKNPKDNGEIVLPENPEDFQHGATA